MSEDGEENLITSGKVVHYNKSSGTVGNPKRIPLTEEAFQVFQKYNGPYRMGLVAKELGEDWINGRNMSIAESIAEIQHVKSGVTYGALSVKMIGEFRPYLGMSFTSPDEAILSGIGNQHQISACTFRTDGPGSYEYGSELSWIFTGSIALYGTELGASG